MNKTCMRRKRAACAALLTSMVMGVAGCGGNSDSAAPAGTNDTADTGSQSTQRSVAEIDGGTVQGTLLHTAEVEPGHTVRYYEFDSTLQFAIETRSAQQAPRLRPDSVTLAQMYADAMGDAALPEVLLAADASRERALASQAPATEQAASVAQALVLPLPQREQAASTDACSSDQLGDQWGAYWFATTFCFPGNGTSVDACRVNQTEYDDRRNNHATFRASKNFYWVQMEGDFLSSGVSEGWAFHGSNGPGGITRLWSYRVAPRQVRTANFTAGNGWFFGGRAFSGCGHAHMGVRWKTPTVVTRPL